jgi:hypothetical protein
MIFRPKSSKKEVRDAIFQMKHTKGPVPDGFPVKLFEVFLESY